jgi:hypothetical protein
LISYVFVFIGEEYITATWVDKLDSIILCEIKYCLDLFDIFVCRRNLFEKKNYHISHPRLGQNTTRKKKKKKKIKFEVISGDVKQHEKRKGTKLNEKMQKSKERKKKPMYITHCMQKMLISHRSLNHPPRGCFSFSFFPCFGSIILRIL